MKIKLIISLLSLLILFSACNVTKNSRKPKEPMPEWVENRPSPGMFYIGIGSSQKAGLSPDAFKENARNSALNALSSDISVNISSSSVINTIETDYQLSETYTRQIRSSSERNIEGYEIVDTWDGGDYYWVYCRLSKATYQTQKQAKKNNALLQAKTKYIQANLLKNEGKQFEAINSYIRSFADITEYLAESTEVSIDGKTIDLGSSVYKDLIQSINEIRFNSTKNPLEVTSSMNINPRFLEIRVCNKAGKPIPNIPVILKFTTGGLSDNKLSSDQNGIIHLPLDKIKSKKQVETLTLEVDMLSLSRLSKDIFIRTVIKKIPPPTYQLVFNVMTPRIFIESSEKSFGKKNTEDILKNSMFESLARNNIRVATTPSESDYIIRIESDSKKGDASSYQRSAVVHYSISVLDKDNRIIYRKDETGIMGYGDNESEANKEAYEEASNRMKRKNANLVFQEIF